jgi:hypothetical protein
VLVTQRSHYLLYNEGHVKLRETPSSVKEIVRVAVECSSDCVIFCMCSSVLALSLRGPIYDNIAHHAAFPVWCFCDNNIRSTNILLYGYIDYQLYPKWKNWISSSTPTLTLSMIKSTVCAWLQSLGYSISRRPEIYDGSRIHPWTLKSRISQFKPIRIHDINKF